MMAAESRQVVEWVIADRVEFDQLQEHNYNSFKSFIQIQYAEILT